jgi:PadR family transcriptional regulator
MAGDIYLGEFEHLVLLAVLRLGDDAYAVPVRSEIEDRARRTVARGALYTTLDRLEQKGLLRSRVGDPIAERGGRARRYYHVTARGLACLRAARASIDSLSAGLPIEPERATN